MHSSSVQGARHDGNPHRSHSWFGEGGEVMAHEAWDSPENLEAIGAVLMRILAEVGVDPADPSTMPPHPPVQPQADHRADA